MTTELWMLIGVVMVFIAVVAVQAISLIAEIGTAEAAGNRENIAVSDSGLAGRARRTVANHIEGIAIFAPLVLVAAIAGVSTPMTVLGAKVYLGSRIAHAVSYLAGIIWVRTVAFAAGMIAIITILVELVQL